MRSVKKINLLLLANAQEQSSLFTINAFGNGFQSNIAKKIKRNKLHS
jgi:hypothetical protein